jgi:hypothetical protein
LLSAFHQPFLARGIFPGSHKYNLTIDFFRFLSVGVSRLVDKTESRMYRNAQRGHDG